MGMSFQKVQIWSLLGLHCPFGGSCNLGLDKARLPFEKILDQKGGGGL